ncbi:MAG: hypothetical protein DMD81_27810, partial [Candidatus Rokuibacteriota bacterium]
MAILHRRVLLELRSSVVTAAHGPHSGIHFWTLTEASACTEMACRDTARWTLGLEEICAKAARQGPGKVY